MVVLNFLNFLNFSSSSEKLDDEELQDESTILLSPPRGGASTPLPTSEPVIPQQSAEEDQDAGDGRDSTEKRNSDLDREDSMMTENQTTRFIVDSVEESVNESDGEGCMRLFSQCVHAKNVINSITVLCIKNMFCKSRIYLI